MIGRRDARAALTGHCDVRAALTGCRGGETHARSAAWSYGTDRDGTSAGARGETESQRGRRESEGEVLRRRRRRTRRRRRGGCVGRKRGKAK